MGVKYYPNCYCKNQFVCYTHSMRIYFTAPIKRVEVFKDKIKAIQKTIINLGYKNLDDIASRLDDASFYEKLDKGGNKAHEDFYNQTITFVKTADVNVFECSVPSLGVGYQVEKSLAFSKPTIVLYYNNYIPHFLKGTQHDKLFVQQYNDTNLSSVLKTTIETARSAADKRFNFFISPSQLTYINEEARKLGLTKSSFIRQLILEHKRKHG